MMSGFPSGDTINTAIGELRTTAPVEARHSNSRRSSEAKTALGDQETPPIVEIPYIRDDTEAATPSAA